MNLTEPYGRLDQPAQPDGDGFFVGVDERGAPTQLRPGYVSRSKNKRYRNGEAATRPGIVTLPWMQGDGLTPFTDTYGGAVFHDPQQGVDWILIAADGGVWKTRPNCVATAVPLPAGVTLTRATFQGFCQARNALLLLRGTEATLECRDLDTGFIEIVKDPEDGTDPMPATSFASYFSNRVFAVEGRDNVAASDALDYTKYQPVTNTFKINEGDSDALLAIYPWNEDTLVMFKERTVWKVVGVYGDLSQARGPLNVTKQYGISSARSIVDAGTDLYWQSELGVVNLRLTDLNQEQATARVLSEPMEQTFKRLNGQYVDRARLAVWDGKLYWAFAGDDARILGDELVAAGAVFNGGGQYAVATTAGKDYALTLHGTETLTNDAATLEGPQTFTAGASVILVGTPGAAVTSSVKLVRFAGVNNLCAVYDLQNGAWAGVDEGAAIAVVDFLRITVHGVPRLLFISADGWLRMYEEGFEDSVPALVAGLWEIVPAPIEDDVTLRGFPCADARGKRFTFLGLLLSTWAPNYEVTAVVTGVNASTTYAANQTRDRLKYFAHGTPAWDPTNINDDHGKAGREDYSVRLDDAAGGLGLGSGVAPDLHQDSAHPVPIDERGRWIQPRIRNTQGRCVLRAALLEGLSEPAGNSTNLN